MERKRSHRKSSAHWIADTEGRIKSRKLLRCRGPEADVTVQAPEGSESDIDNSISYVNEAFFQANGPDPVDSDKETDAGVYSTDDASEDSEEGDEDIVRDKETFVVVVGFLKDIQGMARIHQEKMLQHISSHHKRLPNFPSNLYYMDKFLRPYYLTPLKHLFCL
ncbi:hypothetical protein RvY_03135 [Ramazzottius varieornatus]|uniref:Uncharacterized protein n=1 Tax=Ramazzottius varieornatus TaxID=947166 RepID=A0A1D1UMV5_RAMVA|nr:hypothetical protein RvY_03135 [Ramazzottius varieornatus]